MYSLLAKLAAPSQPISAQSALAPSAPLRLSIVEQAIRDVAKTCNRYRIPHYEPGDEEYERSVANPNLLYRFSRPKLVVQPKTIEHVEAIVKTAVTLRVRITIKNGGHSYAGFSTTDNGILLDLVQMHKVTLDMGSSPKTVTLEGGALWGHAYKKLINGRYDGYIINGGRCPTVGVSGFVLGGGLGPFSRSFGMGCDTLLEATIVTAKGKVTVRNTDSRDSDKGRLFWALRGAGAGNFGVVVRLKMRVRKLRNKEVVAGRHTLIAPPESQARNFLSTMEKFYTANWQDRMTIDSTWFCDLQQNDGRPQVRFITYFDGSKSSFDKSIDRNIWDNRLATQLKRRSLPEKSTRFLHETLVAQWSEETKRAFPDEANRSYAVYASFVFEKDRRNIGIILRTVLQYMESFKRRFDGEQGQLQVTFIHAGGQIKSRSPSSTAFRWRSGEFHAYIMIQWSQKWLERDMRRFCQRFKNELRQYSVEERASFINFPDASLRSPDHEKAYYGTNRRKLRDVKFTWDRSNFFRFGQGLRPQKQTQSLQRTTKRRRKGSRTRWAAAHIAHGEVPASLGIFDEDAQVNAYFASEGFGNSALNDDSSEGGSISDSDECSITDVESQWSSDDDEAPVPMQCALLGAHAIANHTVNFEDDEEATDWAATKQWDNLEAKYIPRAMESSKWGF